MKLRNKNNTFSLLHHQKLLNWLKIIPKMLTKGKEDSLQVKLWHCEFDSTRKIKTTTKWRKFSVLQRDLWMCICERIAAAMFTSKIASKFVRWDALTMNIRMNVFIVMMQMLVWNLFLVDGRRLLVFVFRLLIFMLVNYFLMDLNGMCMNLFNNWLHFLLDNRLLVMDVQGFNECVRVLLLLYLHRNMNDDFSFASTVLLFSLLLTNFFYL